MQNSKLIEQLEKANPEKQIIVTQWGSGRKFIIKGTVEYQDGIFMYIDPIDNPKTKRPKKGNQTPRV